MIEKTITDNNTLGLKSAAVKLTLPVIEITCLMSNESSMDSEIKRRLLAVIEQIIDKQQS